VLYSFEWNPKKAEENLRKHSISFVRAATIFHDPNAVSTFDIEHSQDEDRWITMGIDSSGSLLVVIHTFMQTDARSSRVRIISARKATKLEATYHTEEFL
jgi:uncharacterized protein